MRILFCLFLLGFSACAGEGVALARTGDELTVTIKIDVTDIRAANASVEQKRAAMMRRAIEYLHRANSTIGKSVAEIEADAAAKILEINAEAARLKALKPSGSL